MSKLGVVSRTDLQIPCVICGMVTVSALEYIEHLQSHAQPEGEKDAFQGRMLIEITLDACKRLVSELRLRDGVSNKSLVALMCDVIYHVEKMMKAALNHDIAEFENSAKIILKDDCDYVLHNLHETLQALPRVGSEYWVGEKRRLSHVADANHGDRYGSSSRKVTDNAEAPRTPNVSKKRYREGPDAMYDRPYPVLPVPLSRAGLGPYTIPDVVPGSSGSMAPPPLEYDRGRSWERPGLPLKFESRPYYGPVSTRSSVASDLAAMPRSGSGHYPSTPTGNGAWRRSENMTYSVQSVPPLSQSRRQYPPYYHGSSVKETTVRRDADQNSPQSAPLWRQGTLPPLGGPQERHVSTKPPIPDTDIAMSGRAGLSVYRRHLGHFEDHYRGIVAPQGYESEHKTSFMHTKSMQGALPRGGIDRAVALFEGFEQGEGSRKKAQPRKWSKQEDEALRAAVNEIGDKNWKEIAQKVKGRNHTQCLQRWTKVLQPGLVKGLWSPEEDEALKKYVAEDNKKWGKIATKIDGRTSKQCRERWYNHLDPTIDRSAYTSEEDQIIIAGQAKLGNQWSKIAKRLPGRTEDSVKIRWKTLKKQKSTTELQKRLKGIEKGET